MRSVSLFVFALVVAVCATNPVVPKDKEKAKATMAKVVVRNEGYPAMEIHWKRGEETGSFTGEGEIPVGMETILYVKSRSAQDMYTFANWTVDFAQPKSFEALHGLKVKPANEDQKVTVHVVPPTTNWSGTTSRYKGVFLLCRAFVSQTLLDEWRKVGAKGLAMEMAETIVKERSNKGHFGRFQSATGIICFVPSSGDDVPDAFRKATAEELRVPIEEMLKVIEQQRPHRGQPVSPLGEQSINEYLSV